LYKRVKVILIIKDILENDVGLQRLKYPLAFEVRKFMTQNKPDLANQIRQEELREEDPNLFLQNAKIKYSNQTII
jgi:hypothetical protein